MFKRKTSKDEKKLNISAEQLPLYLETEDRKIALTYPGDVVESLRYMLTRLGKTQPLPSVVY